MDLVTAKRVMPPWTLPISSPSNVIVKTVDLPQLTLHSLARIRMFGRRDVSPGKLVKSLNPKLVTVTVTYEKPRESWVS